MLPTMHAAWQLCWVYVASTWQQGSSALEPPECSCAALLCTPCRWAAVDGGEDLHDVVEAELEAATGQRVDLEPEPRSGYGPDPT